MHKSLLMLLTALSLHAGLLDFQILADAKEAYQRGDYERAATLYGRVETKNDAARYNLGDALYKQQKYDEALKAFSQINDPLLKPKALHNSGNAYAKLDRIDEAIKAYEEALKLYEDEDTRYNLELLKKQKEQQEKQEQREQNQQDQPQKDQHQNDQKQDQEQNSQNGQQNQDKKPHESKPQQNSEANQNKQDQQQQQQNRQEPSEKSKQEEQHAEHEAAIQETPPISDMEERKYNQMLNQRGIKTLMVPLENKGEPREDETTPW